MKPEILYKYRDDSDRTEEIIKNKKIWLSSPIQLNDPLECRIGEIPKDWEERTIFELEQAQIMGAVTTLPTFQPPETLFSLSERSTRKWLKRFRNLSHDRKIKALRTLYSEHGMKLSNPRDIFKDMRHRLSLVGVFSLSETCSNELMWAHYGDNHKGIVFGFNTTGDCKLASTRNCLPVNYAKEKPMFKVGFKNEVHIMTPYSGISNIQRVSFEDDTFKSTISTKTPAWEYEKEWRYIEEESGLFDFPGTLNQVIFGLRMNKERKLFYKNLIDKHIKNDISFFEIVESSDLSEFKVQMYR
ncbi:DUF2971 domain-containing protein [Yersinia enterocolitica]|nr:DUF2971 domain-containing protein [Yersinia enterocolitica]EKN5100141.1 DUF2971 domain-containing protein [Yersinia enterocolitica]EKN6054702.1 DUF2971 domain-containing protein [Yersinia enterocolitica]